MSTINCKLPRWDCRSAHDQMLLEEWTNKQLNLLDEPTASDLQFELDMANDDTFADAVSKDLGRTLIRGRIINAIRGYKETAEEKRFHAAMGIKVDVAPNFSNLVQLVGNKPEWFRFALWQLWQLAHRPSVIGKKNNQGRKKGESRPSDYSPLERDILSDASNDVDRIRMVWKRHFKKQNRSERQPPTAVQIAARRYGVGERLLMNWRSNH
jgi:hypothetical protein